MKALINNPVFRWIAVVPGAFLAAMAATFPWHWVVMFYANFVPIPEGEAIPGVSFLVRLIEPENVERAGVGFLTPFILISVAARIAPNFKRATAVCFSFLTVLMVGYLWFLGTDVITPRSQNIDAIPSLVAVFLNGIGI